MATTGGATAGLNAGLRLAAARSIAPGSAAARFTAPRSAAAARSVTSGSATARCTGPRSASAARSVTTGSATARCTGPRSAAVARSATTAGLTAPRSAAARFTAPRFSALHQQVGRVRSGSRIVPSRCAADAPPSSTDATPPADTPPSSTDATPPRQLPDTSKLMKFWNEIKPIGFSLAILFVAVCIGVMACTYDAKVGWAANAVTMCEKIEKVHKLLSHILPLVVAIVKSFW